jgi:deoxyribonuclease V
MGLATQAGIELNKSSIGVAKRLLFGDIEKNIVKIEGSKKGYLFFSSEKIKRPIFVSPGYKISFKSTMKVVKKFSKYKIPEPLRQAHILAKKTLKL